MNLQKYKSKCVKDFRLPMESGNRPEKLVAETSKCVKDFRLLMESGNRPEKRVKETSKIWRGLLQLTSGKDPFNSRLMLKSRTYKEITDPLTASIESVTENATVETGLEEDAASTETGSPSDDDMDSFHLQLVERVSVLEKIIAELKAKGCGCKQSVSPSATK
ncbi:hypothetical protein LWI29_008548 [Acer saccharum]|uniref:Uncharacterized protein n=1 Tax=Acer saccharum TaxID=4024 RepID=A0AA39SLI2_ACESA|nr:hypothetical protein LWI29_008548 [Acer saccharum]